MALNESIHIPAHYNIYNGKNDRELRVDFSIPDSGTNEHTGILVFVPGFSGSIDSNIYKKMRNYFADSFNFVTVQCDYFGSRFMQSTDNWHLKGDFSTISHNFTEIELQQIYADNSKALQILNTKNTQIHVMAKIDENLDEFADLGYMQAIDVLTAVEVVKIILQENELPFNDSNVIGYGHSQGGYILNLANRLAPFVFSQIVENSAWVRPEFFYRNRILRVKQNQLVIDMEFDYLGKSILKDLDSLSVRNLFHDFKNGAYYHSYLGTTDILIDIENKKSTLKNIDFVDFQLIDNSRIDGIAIKSTNHGLDADFIKLLEMVFAKGVRHKNPNKKQLHYEIISSKTKIIVDYSDSLPIFHLKLL
ncbi:DUF2920 family protein [Lysinibacillus fusiformis]|uniref:DUF2920 family protein n=1 Tax=Lysinibacillus fusiformis TaxID=28031 RepID=UPI0021C24EC0|nr:DUF2920 family protein [Lysinibacillus fusiformis]UXJ69546.1 DUF2920 family protein [Lysinibacillus fusiformis]